jgi:hypothetical protein
MKILPTEFDGQSIRRIYDEATETWWFSVVDVVQVLTDSSIPKRYWSDLRRKLEKESGQPYEEIVRLKMLSPDGKLRETDCAETETLFRIIQSIPSKKAEPFKRWLAKVGYERVQEIENPELAQERMKKDSIRTEEQKFEKNKPFIVIPISDASVKIKTVMIISRNTTFTKSTMYCFWIILFYITLYTTDLWSSIIFILASSS